MTEKQCCRTCFYCSLRCQENWPDKGDCLVPLPPSVKFVTKRCMDLDKDGVWCLLWEPNKEKENENMVEEEQPGVSFIEACEAVTAGKRVRRVMGALWHQMEDFNDAPFTKCWMRQYLLARWEIEPEEPKESCVVCGGMPFFKEDKSGGCWEIFCTGKHDVINKADRRFSFAHRDRGTCIELWDLIMKHLREKGTEAPE